MTSCEELFIVDASRHLESDSESDAEILPFVLPVFNKYKSSELECFKEGGPVIGSRCDILPNDVYVNVYPDTESPRERLIHQKHTLKSSLDECDKKNVASKLGFETLEQLPAFQSRRQLKKLGMREKEKTKGFHWYNMSAPEMTDEKKNDLMVVQMRQALDPKHFYKRSTTTKTQPKYFEVGTYVESPVDFYSSRLPKKERKKTLVEELMADMEFCRYQKKKMTEILQSRPKKFHPKEKTKKSKLKRAMLHSSKKKKKK